MECAQTLDQIAKGKLKDTAFPFVDTAIRERPQEVFIFMVGGCTYEEAAAVNAFNQANEGTAPVTARIHSAHWFRQHWACAPSSAAPTCTTLTGS